MTFTFVEAGDNRRIAERQFATNPEIIGFTLFTSCIGIVAIRKDKSLAGIHLTILNEKDEVFGADPNDVQEVLNKLGDIDKVIIVGQDGVWKNPANGDDFVKTYENLQKQLGSNLQILDADQEGKGAKGVYHAKIVDNDIKLMICIESQTGPQPGQTSRSSDNFSSQEDPIVGPEGTPITFTLPDGITVNIADDNRNAPDPTLFTDVTNGKEEKNPYINELYVAEVRGANENFFVCIEKA